MKKLLSGTPVVIIASATTALFFVIYGGMAGNDEDELVFKIFAALVVAGFALLPSALLFYLWRKEGKTSDTRALAGIFISSMITLLTQLLYYSKAVFHSQSSTDGMIFFSLPFILLLTIAAIQVIAGLIGRRHSGV